MILQRIPGERFSVVSAAWRDRAVVILAGGPSLTREDFLAVAAARAADRVRVIAINDSYLLAPWADVHYAADAKWHGWHTQGIAKPLLGLTADQVRDAWAEFPGERCSIQSSAPKLPENVHVLRNLHYPLLGNGLSKDPGALGTGRHGGFQALNLAILAGARAAILCGYDASSGDNGRRHWHGEHPDCSQGPSAYDAFRRSFVEAQDDIFASGIRVVNCSLASRIDTFEKMPLERALAEVA